MFDFTGKIVLVTGAGSGIGRSAALAFAKAGANLAVVDVVREKVDETAQLVQQQGGEAIALYADVTNEEEIAAYVEGAVEKFGRIDVFLNNAGWQGLIKSIPEYPTEAFDKVMGINVRGAFLGLKYVLPVMIAQKSGTVVNTASGAAYMASPNMVAYIASKHAVLGITKVAAHEVARQGIRVNAVCPGQVNTQMMRAIEEGVAPGAGQAVKEAASAAIPDGRYAEPEEIANAMMYLASDLSSHITGQGLLVDGGLFMK